MISLQSWLKGNDICFIEDEPCIQDTEFYEKFEKDHSSWSITACPPPKSKRNKNNGEPQTVEVIEDDEGSDDSEAS